MYWWNFNSWPYLRVAIISEHQNDKTSRGAARSDRPYCEVECLNILLLKTLSQQLLAHTILFSEYSSSALSFTNLFRSDLVFLRHSSEAKCTYKIIMNTGVCSSCVDITWAASYGRDCKIVIKITRHLNTSKPSSWFDTTYETLSGYYTFVFITKNYTLN